MAIHVSFDEKVQSLAGGAAGVDVAGATVQTALFQVARQYPGLHMFNCEGEMRSVLKVERNGEKAELSEPVADGDRLRLYVG